MSQEKERVDQLKGLILDILHESSGGLKIIALMTKLAEFEQGYYITRYSTELIEKYIREIPGVGILEYGYNMGEFIRVKQFVYLKLPSDGKTS